MTKSATYGSANTMTRTDLRKPTEGRTDCGRRRCLTAFWQLPKTQRQVRHLESPCSAGRRPRRRLFQPRGRGLYIWTANHAADWRSRIRGPCRNFRQHARRSPANSLDEVINRQDVDFRGPHPSWSRCSSRLRAVAQAATDCSKATRKTSKDC